EGGASAEEAGAAGEEPAAGAAAPGHARGGIPRGGARELTRVSVACDGPTSRDKDRRVRVSAAPIVFRDYCHGCVTAQRIHFPPPCVILSERGRSTPRRPSQPGQRRTPQHHTQGVKRRCPDLCL